MQPVRLHLSLHRHVKRTFRPASNRIAEEERHNREKSDGL